MRFLHPEYAWWLAAAFGAIALLKWRVRWHFAAFTSILPGRLARYRASFFRRLPFAVLAIAAALAGLALMRPVLPFPQGDLHSKRLAIILLPSPSPPLS